MHFFIRLTLFVGALYQPIYSSASPSTMTVVDTWQANFSAPTSRYGHAVLGDTPEWGKLCIKGPDAKGCVTLPRHRVFEDLKPRLADVDNDGRLEAIVVESDVRAGAALVVYQLDASGHLSRVATPFIGTRFRWLAPVGIADLDDDGYIEIAYVDRPHLAKVLRIWRYQNGNLQQVAAKTGFSNHRIGDAYIVGGLRRCDGRPLEMITANASWSEVMAIQFDGERLISSSVGTLFDRSDIAQVMDCQTI